MEFRKLFRSDKLTTDGVAIGRVGARQIAVVRQGDKYSAFKNACPHAGAPLSGGVVSGDIIECPRHRWEFRLSDGACLEHELYCLRLYDVKVEDGWIHVREREPEIW